MKQLYIELASLLQARDNCILRGNHEMADLQEERAVNLAKAMMPSGSGIDNGTMLDLDESNPEKLVFTFDFHHMNEHGFYDGWTNHKAVVTPSLVFAFKLRIVGVNRNDIKDMLYDVFSAALTQGDPNPHSGN